MDKEREERYSFQWKNCEKEPCYTSAGICSLQSRLDKFLDDNGLDITTAGMLINGPNEVRPKLKFSVVDKKSSGKKTLKACYLCGEESGQLEDANQTIFPLITGSSGVLSFNSCGGKPEKSMLEMFFAWQICSSQWILHVSKR